MWKFTGCQVEINTLLHPNEHTERILWYRVTQLSWEQSKWCIFSFQSKFSCPKTTQIFLKKIFYQELKISRTTFGKIIFRFNDFWQTLFSKNRPYFWWLTTRLCDILLQNPPSVFIGIQKSIEFHLPTDKFPQPSPH